MEGSLEIGLSLVPVAAPPAWGNRSRPSKCPVLPPPAPPSPPPPPPHPAPPHPPPHPGPPRPGPHNAPSAKPSASGYSYATATALLLAGAVLVGICLCVWACCRPNGRGAAGRTPLLTTQQQQQPDVMQVVCPDGAAAGSMIEVQTQDGRSFNCRIPPGVAPGQAFSLHVPAAHAQQVQPQGGRPQQSHKPYQAFTSLDEAQANARQ